MLDRQKSVPAGILLMMQEVTHKEKEKVTESLANKINNLIDIKSKLSSTGEAGGGKGRCVGSLWVTLG